MCPIGTYGRRLKSTWLREEADMERGRVWPERDGGSCSPPALLPSLETKLGDPLETKLGEPPLMDSNNS